MDDLGCWSPRQPAKARRQCALEAANGSYGAAHRLLQGRAATARNPKEKRAARADRDWFMDIVIAQNMNWENDERRKKLGFE